MHSASFHAAILRNIETSTGSIWSELLKVFKMEDLFPFLFRTHIYRDSLPSKFCRNWVKFVNMHMYWGLQSRLKNCALLRRCFALWVSTRSCTAKDTCPINIHLLHYFQESVEAASFKPLRIKAVLATLQEIWQGRQLMKRTSLWSRFMTWSWQQKKVSKRGARPVQEWCIGSWETLAKVHKQCSKSFTVHSQQAKRLQFAQEHLQWTIKDWQAVVLIGESTFCTKWDQMRVHRPEKSEIDLFSSNYVARNHYHQLACQRIRFNRPPDCECVGSDHKGWPQASLPHHSTTLLKSLWRHFDYKLLQHTYLSCDTLKEERTMVQ